MGFLIPPHSLTNSEIQKYYQNELKFNVVYSRDNLSNKIKDGTYSDIGTHWITLYALNDNGTYFDSFWVEHISKNFLVIKTQATIFRIQAYNWVMWGHFCIGFIDFMLKDKNLTDFTNLFLPNDLTKMMTWF